MAASALGQTRKTAGLKELLCPRHFNSHRQQVLGLAIGTPGKYSTSFDRNMGLFHGIHVDSFDRLPPLERESSRNRISVNLGRDDRWLVFAPTSIVAMTRLTAPCHNWPRGVLRAFFDRYPDHPIHRIRLAPGEAYIAPTDNLAHDGYTVGKRGIDVSFNVLGDFHGGGR